MASIRALLRRGSDDEGMTLIEVLVAFLIFTVIALGVGYSSVTVLRMTKDIRSRAVATNLAATELDLARAAGDPFVVVNGTREVVRSGTTFTVARSTSWVTTSGSDITCGTGTGTLQSKRVNVTVTWTGQLSTTQPVRTDTLISPDTRINDPSLGTVRVSVLGADGSGAQGVGVTITALSGGATALSEQPAATNSDGCSFALKVAPGTYRVAISRAASVDQLQDPAPTATVVVTAGASVATQFQYDYSGTFTLTYASNAPAPTPKLPDNLDTTYLSTYGAYVDSGRKTQVSLHPVISYSPVAGKYIAPSQSGAGCISVDPAAWPAATVNGVNLAAGVPTTPVAAAPRGAASMSIPMGIVTVKNNSNAYLTAVSATASASAADPGCANGMSYTFGRVLVNGTTTIALPYGSWNLYANSTGTGTAITTSNLTIVGSVVGAPPAGTVITLDPRAAR